MERLIETFPTEGFVTRVGRADNPFRSSGRRLLHLGAHPPIDDADLDEVWLELCEELLGSDYRRAVGELVELDLGQHGLQVSIYRNGSEEWLPAHIDNWLRCRPRPCTSTRSGARLGR